MLGELHTLKGEARMLGWSNLATLAHVLEERLGEERPDAEALSAVLDSMLLSLSPQTTEDVAEELWSTALSALGVEVLAETGEASEGGAGVEGDASVEGSGNAMGTAGDESPAAEQGKVGGRGEAVQAREASVDEPEAKKRERWVQVDAGTVDHLGELLASLSGDLGQFVSGLSDVMAARTSLEQRETDAKAERLKSRLSDALLLSLDLRLTPIEPVLGRLATHARVLASDRGKSITTQARSGGVRMERDIIDRLGEPLLHLVSNAVDHGIEPSNERGDKPPVARIDLAAESEGMMVKLTITDDGRGVDLQRVRHKAGQRGTNEETDGADGTLSVLFQPGFSTREDVDEVSGRGVGLDVVKRQVEALGGSVAIQSKLGVGTSFSLSVPAGLAQERLLVIQVGETLYGVADRLVLSVESANFPDEGGVQETTFRYRDETLPLRLLSSLLAVHPGGPASLVIIVRLGERLYAIGCEQVLGHFELIRRPTGPGLSALAGVCASAQIDDGRMVLVLDPRLLRRQLGRPASDSARSVTKGSGDAASDRRERVLVVDDSVVVRDLLAEVLTSAGYQVRGVKNGKEALAELSSFDPVLVLSDIEMPEMDGFRLLEAIRVRDESLPVVLVTARSSEQDRQRAEALGANAYVTKGEFRSESLVDVVGRLRRGSS